MGEAKRRKAHQQETDQALKDVDMRRVASAVSKLCRASSDQLGSDCLTQAGLAQYVLKQLGIESTLEIGYAAWRVGPGDGDVITHLPLPNVAQISPRHVPYHAWLRVGSKIFDVTTSDLQYKARQLDALDGGSTTVQWAPPFLFVDPSEVSALEKVTQDTPGLFFYRPDSTLRRLILSEKDQIVDDRDAKLAWIIYQNPETAVLGPNNLDDEKVQESPRRPSNRP